jgi:uncharacterized protein
MPIDWLTPAAALLTGLMGGVHCAAMCGGIAAGFSALPGEGGWRRALEPNLGRIAGYTFAGALAGGLGYGIVGLARTEWIMPASRMLLGLVLIVAALRLLDRNGRLIFLPRPGAGVWQWLRPLQRRLLPANTTGRRLALGMLWGWMPCGLSTTMLAAAWLQADARNGALTMAAFGLGTLPLMWPLTWSGARLGQRLQRGGWRMAIGSLVLAAGLLTLAAPWLVEVPALHRWLVLLGCVPAPT